MKIDLEAAIRELEQEGEMTPVANEKARELGWIA